MTVGRLSLNPTEGASVKIRCRPLMSGTWEGAALDPALFEMLAPAADRVVVEQKRVGDFLAVPPVVQKHQGVRAARAGLCGGGRNAWKADHQSGSEGPPVAVNSPSPRETTRCGERCSVPFLRRLYLPRSIMCRSSASGSHLAQYVRAQSFFEHIGETRG
jgi:hypothetical protein